MEQKTLVSAKEFLSMIKLNPFYITADMFGNYTIRNSCLLKNSRI